MVTSIVFIALIGTLQFNSAISAAINYEPIKITVNENFNAQHGQVSPELQGREPGVLHQGANFYFKPQLNLPPNYIPSHTEALIKLIQQHHHSCAKDTSKVVVEKDKLIEILKPFMYPVTDISKETLSEIVLEKENNVEIVKPIIITEEPKPVTPEFLVIPEVPVLSPLSLHDISAIIEEEVKKEESIVLDEPTVMEEVKIEEPIVVDVEPKPISSELGVIPEAPVLPSLSLHDIASIIEEEVEKEESITLEEPTGVFPTIPEIDVRPIEEPITNYVEPKPITSELVVIPEAPVLPPLSLHDISSIIEEEVNKVESIILEESTGVFPIIPEIDVRPIEEPIINYVEPKPITSKPVVIPEAPVLPPLSLYDIPSIVEEEVKKEESIIMLEKPTGVFPTITELAVGPITEPIIYYGEPKPITSGLVVIPEAPVLPALSLNDIQVVEEEAKIEGPIVVDVEPKPAIQEIVAIPEAPILPSLSFHDITSIIEEEVKTEESVIFEEPIGVFPTIPEIDVRPIEESIINYVEPKPITSELLVIPEAPVLPPLSSNDIHVVDEEMKIVETIVESKPATQELVVIPEGPILPPLSLHDISSIIKEEVKKEESITFQELTGVLPTIPENAVRPIEKPTINYPKPITSELVDIPEAPMLPPLTFSDFPYTVEDEVKKEESVIFAGSTGVFPSVLEISARPETVIVNVEPKPTIQEILVIPQAPVLPPLTDYPVVEEVKLEESIILEESTDLSPPILESSMRPNSPEAIIIDVEPKPTTSELLVIPEAPVLPPLSSNDIHVVDEEMKIVETIVESKPATQELVVIPEGPILPPLSLHDMSSIIEEEVKKEESITLEELTGVFPTIPEIAVRPIEKPTINYPKPITSELVDIPEAPMLPPLTFSDFPYTVEDEVKKEESVILAGSTGVFPSVLEISARPETFIDNVEPKPTIQEILVIPQAPVLPPLTDYPVVEEVKLEESIILEESTDLSPPILESSMRPISPEVIIIDVEPKPTTSELVVVPEAPVLPPLSYNGIPPLFEEVEIEESIKVEESTGVFPSIPEISARPLTEPLIVFETAESFALENNIFPIATEEVKIEIPILLEQSIEVFPPIAEISSGPTLQESENTDSYVLEEVPQPNPGTVITVNETLPPTIISKPSNNLGVFSYVPFLSQLSNPAPNTKKLTITKPASLERFLLKKHPFRLPVTPFPKLDLNAIKSIWGNKKQFLYPTSYAHDVVEKRIAPNMAFKKQNAPKRVKIYIRSNVPKGPSYL